MHRLQQELFVIAEAGVNHNGDLAMAKQLIDAAAHAGADAVKFQTWKTELLISPDVVAADYQRANAGVQSQYQMLKELELPFSAFEELKRHADTQRILFMSTPDDHESARFLDGLQDRIKIGSGELTNVPYLRFLAGFGKPVILSTGMGTLAEVELAVAVLTDGGLSRDQITVLHATTEYPAPPASVNMRALTTLRTAFPDLTVGYSDHTIGNEAAIAAVTLGATVIEKHFTLDRSLPGPDHAASMEPDQLADFINSLRLAATMLGDGIKRPQPVELKNRPLVRKHIVATQPIARGEMFSEANLSTRRASTGLGAEHWDLVLGATAPFDFAAGEPIRL